MTPDPMPRIRERLNALDNRLAALAIVSSRHPETAAIVCEILYAFDDVAAALREASAMLERSARRG